MNVTPNMELKYKLTPCNQYDIDALESWLEQCARKGLFVEELLPLHTVFSRGEPRPRRYRLEYAGPQTQSAPPAAMLDLYGEFGWVYVTDSGPFFIFYTDDPQAPEPQTDAVLAAEQLNRLLASLNKRIRETVLIFFAAAFLYFLVSCFFDGLPPLLALIQSNRIGKAAGVILQFGALIPLLRLPYLFAGRAQLLRRKTCLDQGLPLAHLTAHLGVYGKKKLINPLFLYLLPSLLYAVFFCIPLFQTSFDPADALSDFTPISLRQLEGGEIFGQPFRPGGGRPDHPGIFPP